MRYLPAQGRRTTGVLAGVLAAAAILAPGAGSAAASPWAYLEAFGVRVPPPVIVVRQPEDGMKVTVESSDRVRLDFDCHGVEVVDCGARLYRDGEDLGPVEQCAFLPRYPTGTYRIDFEARNRWGDRTTRSVSYGVIDIPGVDKVPFGRDVPCRDTVAPKIRIGSVAGQYERGDAVFADFDCADKPDGASGLARCTAIVTLPRSPTGWRGRMQVRPGERLNTMIAGLYAFEVTAVDRAGNTARRQVRYRVGHPRTGAPNTSFDDRSRY